MPTFDFTAPDGKAYSVDGPEGATPEQAFKILQDHLGAAPAQAGSSAGGVAKSLGTGLAEGAIGLAGLPGDLYHMGLRALGDNLTPESNYGSNAIKKGVEGYTGEFYKPQGIPEELAAKVGQYAPAILGGPETLGMRALTRVAAPAVASEAAKKATEGTAAQPYAELAAGLAGGVGASMAAQKFKAMAAARQATNATPSAEQLLKTGGDQFNQARDMNLVVKPDFTTNAAADMRASLKGFDPEAQGAVFKAADRLENLGTSGPGLPPVAVPMNEVENIRKQLVSLKTSPDASVREAARKAIASLQSSQKAITSAEVLSGDAPAYSKLVSDATGNWAAGKRSNTVMGKVALGNLNAETAGSGANVDNALRQAIKQLVRPVNNDIVPKAARLGFNQPEIDAMNTAARGSLLGNAARYIGKAAPTGIVSGAMSSGAGHLAGGPIGAVALPAVGMIAKKIGDLSTKRAVAAVDSLVRQRSPLAAQVAASLPPHIIQRLNPQTQALLTTLVAADPVLSPRQNAVQQSR